MSDVFARESCLVMASRVAVELGFEYAEDSALEALADVVRYYINHLARRSAANMHHATRSDLALNDLLAAFKQAPAAQTNWKALRDFAFRADGNGWKAPAANVGSVMPAAKRQRAAHYGSLASRDAPQGPRSVHIPKFLPPFPPKIAAKRKRSREDDSEKVDEGNAVAEAEALQLALNRIGNAKARPGSSYAPIDVE